MFSSIRKHRYYKPLLWFTSLILFAFLIWLGSTLVTNPDYFSGDDFVEYWAAGKLNFSGGNPYDPEQLHPLELNTGLIEGEPVLWWSPPWVLSIVMGFGYFEYALGRTLWLIISIVILFICFSQLWSLYGGEFRYRWAAWLIGYTFIPVLDGLKKGQTSFLLLMGVVGFLYFIEKRKYWRAGFFLTFLFVKPQILYLFILAVLLWSLSQKKWSFIAGSVFTILFFTTMAVLANPNVINQFYYTLIHTPPDDLATPTIGGLLRWIFGVERFWLQFLAPILGTTWMVYYWLKNRHNWNWVDKAPLLILVSTMTAAYGWSWDQTVSIVAVFQIAILILPRWRERSSKLIIAAYLVTNLLLLTMRVNQFWTFWLAPALLILYLGSMKTIKSDANRTSTSVHELNS